MSRHAAPGLKPKTGSNRLNMSSGISVGMTFCKKISIGLPSQEGKKRPRPLWAKIQPPIITGHNTLEPQKENGNGSNTITWSNRTAFRY